VFSSHVFLGEQLPPAWRSMRMSGKVLEQEAIAAYRIPIF